MEREPEINAELRQKLREVEELAATDDSFNGPAVKMKRGGKYALISFVGFAFFALILRNGIGNSLIFAAVGGVIGFFVGALQKISAKSGGGRW